MNEDDFLAAELALGLLEGEELLTARGRMASDPGFAALVADWEAKLAPLLDEIGEVQPGPELWTRIAGALDSAPQAGGEVIALRARLRRWQWGSAAAAAAALVIGLMSAPYLQRGAELPQPPGASAEVLLYASLPVGGPEGPRLALTYLPQSGDLLVLANAVPGDGVHDHELWLVAPGAKPVSMGVITPGQQARVHLPPATAARIDAGLGVILTREPLGGALPGGSAGPVVAEGKFTTI